MGAEGNTVRIQNNRPTIISLPPAVRREEHEGMAEDWINVGEPVRLSPAFQASPNVPPRPVATDVPAEDWKRASAHPAVKDMLKERWIEVAKSEDVAVSTQLADLSAAAATAQVETETDPSQIAIWMTAEQREPVKKALNKRLAELQKK